MGVSAEKLSTGMILMSVDVALTVVPPMNLISFFF